VRFADVPGVDEVKDELREVIDFLQHRESMRVWARIFPGDAACWSARHRQDRARPAGHRKVSQKTLRRSAVLPDMDYAVFMRFFNDFCLIIPMKRAFDLSLQ
jgi:hypothetical protein